jgi:2-amino-4-hydroxy-6-hydroxymethyldihydropteridine diphosphokinase
MSKNNHQFLIALGSNISLGRALPLEIIKRAIVELVKNDINLVSLSRFYATPAYPEGSGPNFINSVVKAEADYSSQQILHKLHQIEEKFERQRDSRWSARTLDLDLLAAKREVLPSRKIFQKWFDLPFSEQKKKIPNELVLPHPRIQDRAFVLSPLLDVEPNWIHPILKKTVIQLFEELPEQAKKNIQVVQ